MNVVVRVTRSLGRLFVTLLACLGLVATLTTGALAQDGDGFDLGEGLAPPALPGQGGLTYPNLGSALSGLADDPLGLQYGADFLWGGGSGDGGSGNGVAASPFQPGDTWSHTASMLALSIIVDGDVGRVVDLINASGGDVRNVLGSYIEAYVPPSALARLARTPGVSWAREMPRPMQARGTVTSGGVAQHLAGAWHDAGIKGQGVKIGVIDAPSGATAKDGFTGAPALLGTDLPSAVTARCYTDTGKHTSNIADCSAAGGNDHGTIVAETVMDVAPEASLYIANPPSWGDLRSTAEWMHAQGVQVIVYSILWAFHGPPNGTSPYTYGPLNTVKWAADNGIVWVNAAGNQHKGTWYGPFTDADTDTVHEWRPGTEDQYLDLQPGESARVYIRWDDTWGGADDDLALMVVSKPGQPDEKVIATSNDPQTGDTLHTPREKVTIPTNKGSQEITVALRVKSMDGSKPSWIQLVTWGGTLGTHSDGYSIQSPADSPHPGMLAVGAGSPVGVYNYSSRGPTPDGRVKPDIVGAAGTLTATRGDRYFHGTSAAAPHVGGLAALVVQQNPTFAPTEVTGYLKTHALRHDPWQKATWPNNTEGYGSAQLPSPSCAEDLNGDLNGSRTTSGTWTSRYAEGLKNDCASAVDSAKRSRYYNIRVLQESTVSIDLSSSVDSYLNLRSGYNAQQGAALHSDDNTGTGNNARISATLAAGTYTIEATTAANYRSGAFSLAVSGLAATPEVSLSGGDDITEGSNVRFTLTASPIPSSPLPVKVQVSVKGDYGVTPSTRTINIPTSTGSTDLVLTTSNDAVAEVNGAITATLVKGAGYDVSSSESVATVGVNDNDNYSCHDIVTGDGSIDSALVTNCKQSFYSEDSKRYGRFYSFEIAQDSGVVIEMESTELNPYLMLRQGKDARAGTPLYFNDNAGESQNPPGTALYLNARIAEGLSAGWYTIEASSLDHEETGTFKMQIRGLSPQTSVPVISITDGTDITEGEDASFTLTASPAPADDLNVVVSVTGGEFVTTGSRTVTIPATGSATLTVHTDNDDVFKTDGAITASINNGNGYAVSSTISVSERTGAGIATVNVADDDGGICTEALTSDGNVSGTWANNCKSLKRAEGVGANARYYIFELEQSSKVTIDLTSWSNTYLFLRSGKNPRSAAAIHEDNGVRGNRNHSRISETLAAGWYTIEATTFAYGRTGDFSLTISGLASQPTEPEISIAAGGGVTEGAAASFTVTASPKPAADLDVTISVSQSGDYGATTGSRTVTIPTSGSKTFTVATTNDSADEADGSVTVALSAGSGYTISATKSAATVAVSDDDVPEISIAAGSGVAEGAAASFTLAATPKPAADLDVTITVSQSGDFGATTGSLTVTIPASGSKAFTIATTNDSVDEADGSVTATLNTGIGYTVSSGSATATVAVSDDDDDGGGCGVVLPDDAVSVSEVAAWRDALSTAAAAGIKRFNRVLAALGVDTGETPMTAAQAQGVADWLGNTRWDRIARTLVAVEQAQCGDTKDDLDEPQISIAAGGGVTEGAAASFTVTASPTPAADLDVTVTVSQSGDFGATTGSRTVTIPVSGSETFTVATSNDTADEADGSVTATVASGTGYAVSATKSAATVSVSDDDDPLPVVSIVGGSAVTEGANAIYTLTASPAPAAPLTVNLTVSQSGDFYVGTGPTTVQIATSGTHTLSLGTSNDSIDESDGSVTATINTGTGYTVSSTQSAATVAVSDDDDPPPPPPVPAGCVSDEVLGLARDYFDLNQHRAPSFGRNWRRVLVAFGDVVDDQLTAFTAAEALEGEQVWFGWKPFREALECIEAAQQPTDPQISITAGSAVTEGTAASFTLTASPAPTAALTIDVTVAQTGDFGAATGTRTVTIPTSGSYTLTVSTTGDSVDEADGSVTVSVDAGTGYTVSSSAGSAVVAVADNDVPEVSVTAGSGVTEGGDASFTVTAAPTPYAALSVDVTVAQSGDFGVSTGTRTVTIPTSGSYTLAVSTVGDSVDEADGSVTVSVSGGTGYTVSSSAGSVSVAVSDDDDPPLTVPEISVTAGSAVTEGAAASFTFTANPTPVSALSVSVTVAQSGNYGASTGVRTVTIPTTGSYTLTVATTNDSTDEADGSVTATISTGTGYTVSSSNSSATVAVSDDDDPPPPPPVPAGCVSDEVLESARDYYELHQHRAPGFGRNWRRVLVAFGDVVDEQLTAMTAAEALEGEQRWFGWKPFREALECIEAAQQPTDPQISITAGSAVTEGTAASFTITASPAPAANLDVTVTVSQSGDYGVTTGARTVTIPTTGSYTLTVDTTGDTTDETDGSVTVSIDGGTGYTVSSSDSSATVAVADDDDPPPPPPPPPADPEISIAAGNAVTEGGAASFTITANPVPATALSVSVTVTQTGDFGVTTGARTVIIPTTGSYTLTVSTTGDSVDEPDGSVTVSIDNGTGYAVSSSNSSATVAVADDDVPQVSVSAGSSVTEGAAASFTLTANPVPAAGLDVNVTITQSGDYGAATGARTVTIPTTGTATFTVTTTNDTTDETDGSVTATIDTGNSYTVSSTQGAATVAVSDDDDPAPSNTPVISIVAGSAVTEGANATYTITASPAPTTPLTVNLSVSQSGNYYLSPGPATIEIATSGTHTLSLGTRDDNTDEADGSLTVTLTTGTGYTVSTTQNTATVNVADDDLPSPGPPTVTVTDATAVEGQDLTFVVTLSKPNPEPITFRYGGYGRTATMWQDFQIEYNAVHTLAAGETEVNIVVPVIDDNTPENTETLRIYVYATSGIVIRDGFLYATGTITDND